MSDLEAFTTEWERHRQRAQEVNAQNKSVLFEALAATNITTITVDFDGEGDSGQINAICACAGEKETQLPEAKITIQQVHLGQTVPVPSELTLEAAIESLCYDFLWQEHGGWEINDGAYGQFVINVADRTIELEFSARYTDVHTSSHSF